MAGQTAHGHYEPDGYYAGTCGRPAGFNNADTAYGRLAQMLNDDYLLEQQHKLEKAQELVTAEANESSRVLIVQLFIVAAALLALSSPLLGSKDLLFQAATWLRIILVLVWLLLAGSMGCGIYQLFIEVRFFSNSKDIYDKIIRELSWDRIHTAEDLTRAFDKQAYAPDRATQSMLLGQIALLSLGCGLLIMFMAYLILKH